MIKIIVISAIVIGLAGCSSSDDVTVPSIDGSITGLLLNGTWASGCIIDGTDSFTVIATFNNGNGTLEVTGYIGDTTCAIANLTFVEKETFSYILGSDVTVDGTVAGITTATQIDVTDTTDPNSPDFGTIDYDIFAITNLITLYAGNTDGVNDGSTAALRPTQLDDTPFTKQ